MTPPLASNSRMRGALHTCIKVNVNLPLCYIKHHIMKAYEQVEVILYLHACLTFALDGCEWSASRPGHFSSPRKKLCLPIGEPVWAMGLVLSLWIGDRSLSLPSMELRLSSPRQ
jgi:hypothetical protein